MDRLNTRRSGIFGDFELLSVVRNNQLKAADRFEQRISIAYRDLTMMNRLLCPRKGSAEADR